MKKLIIVSTKASSGKGGISTALSGYLSGLEKQNIDFEFVESHWQETNIFVSWLNAFWLIVKLSFKYRKNAVFWFHLGPWLSMFRKFTLAIVPRLVGADTVAHIHSPAFKNYIEKHSFVTKLSLLPYKKIVALTPWWEALLRQHKITKPITVSPNPNNEKYCQVAKEFLNTPRQINNEGEHIKILTMARVAKGKNIDIVIKTMLNLPEHCTLTIAGDGPLLSSHKELVETLGLNKRVTFTGWIDGEKKEALLKEADIFCLPSTYDSFGMVFIEAMAFDLPVVAYGWGPINDVVTSDVGECCQAPTVEDVTESILKVLRKLGQYGGHGPKKVLSQYTPQKVVQHIINLLD